MAAAWPITSRNYAGQAPLAISRIRNLNHAISDPVSDTGRMF